MSRFQPREDAEFNSPCADFYRFPQRIPFFFPAGGSRRPRFDFFTSGLQNHAKMQAFPSKSIFRPAEWKKLQAAI